MFPVCLVEITLIYSFGSIPFIYVTYTEILDHLVHVMYIQWLSITRIAILMLFDMEVNNRLLKIIQDYEIVNNQSMITNAEECQDLTILI